MFSSWHWTVLVSLTFFPVVVAALNRKKNLKADVLENDATSTDPGVLKKYSTFKSYHVQSTGFHYPSIRTFYRPHPQADKLPTKPLPLPLLVFVHGLGGSAAQFGPLLNSIVNLGPCLTVDLPGCGLSGFAPTEWAAYTTEALISLMVQIIESHRDAINDQKVIFIGHSMGCSLAALLASRNSPYTSSVQKYTSGLVAICPRFTPLSAHQESGLRNVLSIPTQIFDLWRIWDRRGGENSASVRRFVGADAERATKRLQLRFNEQSKTAVWRRMAYGFLLPYYEDGVKRGGLPGAEVWGGLDIPVYLIAGEADAVTSPEEVSVIADVLQRAWSSEEQDTLVHENQIQLTPIRTLKTSILPNPASHALIFAPSTCRTISGLIQTFLSDHVDKRLSLGWQLQYLCTEGKWDVKNFEKWQAIQPVSEPIANTFRAMKTMREVDPMHCPKVFVQNWTGRIRAVVDISHESPVYDPSALDRGGIEYHKFPTVSKLPPAAEEVKSFIELVDRLRDAAPSSGPNKDALIAVHCHYGFNRTGFFLVCYMVERLNWNLKDAIEEFEKHRAPGIKHEHFIDTLWVRYSARMKW